MEFQVAQLRVAIEEMRREMLDLGKDKPFTDPEVVKVSQRLDALLNEYDILKCEYSACWGLGAK